MRITTYYISFKLVEILHINYRFGKMPSMNTDHNFQNLVVKTEATNLSHLFNSLFKRDKKKENPWLIRQSIHIM